jgi:hypothetical protein
LFRGRRAHNVAVPLNADEYAFYNESLALVDEFFPPVAVPLARMVYGKRAASSMHALARTLARRLDEMGASAPADAAYRADPDDEDSWAAAEARVLAEASRSAKAEKKAIGDLLTRLRGLLAGGTIPVSKWNPLIATCFAPNGILPGGPEQAVVFTEYADTADWLVDRVTSSGYSARRYSGRDPHPVRDRVRADFQARRFQVLVSTDAGNEGIDLQSAHVLVNWDIPWSLVRLEQRMGRIHRVGQTRDVELFNLIADGTRESEVLRVLLDNFVAAADQLDGRIFDSLSMVAEMVDLDVERMLSDAYRGDEHRAEALTAARAVGPRRLTAAVQRARREEAALKTAVDMAAAAQLLNQDELDRINPAIVEAYLFRLREADVIDASRLAAGDGILLLSSAGDIELPSSLTTAGRARVATSGKALADAAAAGAAIEDVVRLGPGEAAFADLLDFASSAVDADVYQGGTVVDPTSVSDYDLFAFEGSLVEGGGRKSSRWGALLRVDEAGARHVRWELLANLRLDAESGRPPHPGRVLDATERAQQVAAEEVRRRRASMQAWLSDAERQLRRLPSELSRDAGDVARRGAVRAELEARVGERLADLARFAEVSIADVRRVAWCRVKAAALPSVPSEQDSERIAIARVRRWLSDDGWLVADVSTERRGYDLHATRGSSYRCIEVKGVWGSAASDGIRMTANELLVASQQAEHYWLWVVDRCADGTGTLFGAYRDPASEFAALASADAVFRVPGSALKAAAERGGSSA